MRSILTGIFISTITMVFSAWFLSSSILKTLQASKTSSSVNSESIVKKILYGKDSTSYSGNSQSISSYMKAPRQAYSSGRKARVKNTSSPFGAKLSIRDHSNPFAPKLSLRGRKSQEWGRKRTAETYQQEKQSAQNSSSQKTKSSTSSSPIISGYQNYIDILNDQMKD